MPLARHQKGPACHPEACQGTAVQWLTGYRVAAWMDAVPLTVLQALGSLPASSEFHLLWVWVKHLLWTCVVSQVF